MMTIEKDGSKIYEKVEVAKSFTSRLMGLMFKKDLEGKDGLLIEHCNSIHTFFMRFNIDVFFLDSNNEIVQIKRNLKPCRMTRPYFRAVKVLETLPNTDQGKLAIGDQLELVCLN